jgi:ATP-dependent Clp protease ATP-binding subunit ClpC
MSGVMGLGKMPVEPYMESRLLTMEGELAKYVPNQQEAIGRLARAIRKEVVITPGNPRPLGRFLLVGSSNEARKLATVVAQFLFGDGNSVMELDMGEYSTRHQALRLIGHCGGMVPVFFDGTLTEPIWRRPQTVIILTGIEDVHVEAWGVLGPALVEGVLMDERGRSVSFKDSVFFMTTMVGFVDGTTIARSAIERVVPSDVLCKISDILQLR